MLVNCSLRRQCCIAKPWCAKDTGQCRLRMCKKKYRHHFPCRERDQPFVAEARFRHLNFAMKSRFVVRSLAYRIECAGTPCERWDPDAADSNTRRKFDSLGLGPFVCGL